jgi:hypothetical protein
MCHERKPRVRDQRLIGREPAWRVLDSLAQSLLSSIGSSQQQCELSENGILRTCDAEQFSAELELLMLCLLNSADQRGDRAFSYFCAAPDVEEVALPRTPSTRTVLSALVHP